MTENKYCIVPGCRSTSLRCPEKIFLSVPKKEKERLKWLKAASRDSKKFPLSMKSYLACCEDHFDMEKDVKNWREYMFYRDSGLRAQVRLKPGVLPHRFECQKGTRVMGRKSRGFRKSPEAELDEELSNPEVSDSIDQDNVREEKAIKSSTQLDRSCNKRVHSVEESQKKDKILKQMLVLEKTLTDIRKNPKMLIGISTEYFQCIQSLAQRSQCLLVNILIVLKKIKTDLCFESLGKDFGITSQQARCIFERTLPKLASEFKELIAPLQSPDKNNLLPTSFRSELSKLKAFISCIEVNVGEPSNPSNKYLTSSYNYDAFTVKFLLSSTLNGFINFVSKAYYGRTSDTHLLKDCGFARLLPPGSQIVSQSAFKNVEPYLETVGVTLIRPSNLKGRILVKTEVKRIESLINVSKSIISRIYEYRILSLETPIDAELIRFLNDIIQVVAGLVNLQDSLFT